MSAILTIDQIVILSFAGLLAWAALSDLASLTIPNRVSIGVVALYPAFLLARPDLGLPLEALGIAAIVLVIGFSLFCLGLLGGGDAKLLAATALWAGPEFALEFVLVTLLVGGLMSLIMLNPLFRSGLVFGANAIGANGLRDGLVGNSVPYGVAIAIGGFGVAWQLAGL